MEKHIDENNILLENYTQSTCDFWGETEILILSRCGELFEEISSPLVRADLLHAGQSFCQDIMQENEIKAREIIALRIKKELTDKRMTLSKINLSVEELSQVMESAPLGLVLSSLEEDNPVYVYHLMKIFKASTAI